MTSTHFSEVSYPIFPGSAFDSNYTSTGSYVDASVPFDSYSTASYLTASSASSNSSPGSSPSTASDADLYPDPATMNPSLLTSDLTLMGDMLSGTAQLLDLGDFSTPDLFMKTSTADSLTDTNLALFENEQKQQLAIKQHQQRSMESSAAATPSSAPWSYLDQQDIKPAELGLLPDTRVAPADALSRVSPGMNPAVLRGDSEPPASFQTPQGTFYFVPNATSPGLPSASASAVAAHAYTEAAAAAHASQQAKNAKNADKKPGSGRGRGRTKGSGSALSDAFTNILLANGGISLLPAGALAPVWRSKSADGDKKENAERMFICPHPYCGRAFARNFNMQSHLKSHLGIRDFDCTECTKKFSRRYDRARHMAAVHNIIVPDDRKPRKARRKAATHKCTTHDDVDATSVGDASL